MKQVFVLLTILLATGCLGQNGYFGAKNGLELQLFVRPTSDKIHKLNSDQTKTKTINRSVYTSYSLGVSRCYNKNLEFNFNYRFIRNRTSFDKSVYAITDSIFVDNGEDLISETRLNFLEDPVVISHFFGINFKYYWKGSIAPLGKYIGFEAEWGVGSYKASNDIFVGKGYPANPNNIFMVKQELIEKNSINIPKDLKGRMFGIYFLVGRSYPINDFLLFTCGMRFPIIRDISVNNVSMLGFDAQNTDGAKYYENSSFRSILYHSFGKQTRISFNLGIKYTFPKK
jgi:hypothetical protein